MFQSNQHKATDEKTIQNERGAAKTNRNTNEGEKLGNIQVNNKKESQILKVQ